MNINLYLVLDELYALGYLPAEIIKSNATVNLQHATNNSKMVNVNVKNGFITCLQFYRHDLIDRPYSEGPARIDYYKNSTVKSHEKYYSKNVISRPSQEGPSQISYYEDGSLYSKSYSLDLNLFRGNIPSSTSYFQNGKKFIEVWVKEQVNSKRLRYICYYPNGKVSKVAYDTDNTIKVAQYRVDGSLVSYG